VCLPYSTAVGATNSLYYFYVILFVIFSTVVRLSYSILQHPTDSQPGPSTADGIVDNTGSQQPTAPTSVLAYPTAVSQRGRPQKRKQRLFDTAKKNVLFEKLRPAVRDQLRLSWIVSSDVATAAVRTGYKITAGDIDITVRGLGLLKDDRSQHAELQQYCTAECWQVVMQRVSEFSCNETVCGICAAVNSGQSKKVKWVQCDGCVCWVHLMCAGLSRKPRGTWFCGDCEH